MVMERQQTIELLKCGDSKAWEDIVLQYQVPLSRYLYNMVRDKELARDLTQDTFLEAVMRCAVAGNRDAVPQFRMSDKIHRGLALIHLLVAHRAKPHVGVIPCRKRFPIARADKLKSVCAIPNVC